MSSDHHQPNVLLVQFTQTGATSEIAEAFAEPLERHGVDVVREVITPRIPYPFPWRSVGRFFDVMPECVLARTPEIETPRFDPRRDYDLVVIFYQVWFLSPSLPILGFLNHPHAEVLRGKSVVTVVVSRNMWATAGEKMKRSLADRGAIHRDNISVTHQGPIWATFVTIPRLLLYGKRDRLWNLFPPPGIGAGQIRRMAGFGECLAPQLTSCVGHQAPDSDAAELTPPAPPARPFFPGMDAAPVVERYLLPEFIGSYVFTFWAHVITTMGNLGGKWLRRFGTYCFVATLVCLIVVGIPILLVARIVMFPVLNPWIRKYAARLRQPSDAPPRSGEREPAGATVSRF